MGGFVYDLALIQTDREIGKFFKYLKKKKILDDSKIVFTSDHGLESGFPVRKKTKKAAQLPGSDLSQFFFDEFIHVPLIFFPKKNFEVNQISFSSHIDFAPSVLDFCQIPEEKNFKGESIFSKKYFRKYVLSENTGSGLCDVQKKDKFICVRTENLKITYIVNGKNIKERDVFDLKNDPHEIDNLVKEEKFEKDRKKLFVLCENRIKEIYSYV